MRLWFPYITRLQNCFNHILLTIWVGINHFNTSLFILFHEDIDYFNTKILKISRQLVYCKVCTKMHQSTMAWCIAGQELRGDLSSSVDIELGITCKSVQICSTNTTVDFLFEKYEYKLFIIIYILPQSVFFSLWHQFLYFERRIKKGFLK